MALPSVTNTDGRPTWAGPWGHRLAPALRDGHRDVHGGQGGTGSRGKPQRFQPHTPHRGRPDRPEGGRHGPPRGLPRQPGAVPGAGHAVDERGQRRGARGGRRHPARPLPGPLPAKWNAPHCHLRLVCPRVVDSQPRGRPSGGDGARLPDLDQRARRPEKRRPGSRPPKHPGIQDHFAACALLAFLLTQNPPPPGQGGCVWARPN